MRNHIFICILLFMVSLHAQIGNFVGTPFMVSVSNSKYDYSDNTIIIVLTPEYSTVGAVVNRPQIDFGDLQIQDIENIFPITNQKAIETLHSRGSQYQAIYIITLPIHDKNKVLEAIHTLEKIDGIDSAYPNYYYPAVLTPDDPEYTQQWGLHGTHGIQAPQAWDINTGSASTRIGIVDSGIANHPELTQNLTTGWDFVNNNDITDDPHGHGTHIAGIIGAVGNNAQGIAGINWNTTLVPLQVYQYHNETGVYMNGAAIISAIAYATNTWGTAEQISVLNYSVDGYGNDTLTRTAVNNYPGLFVWAAGNSNRDVDPDIASFGSFDLPNIIAVGSITETGERSTFSNFSASNQNVHIYAPGTSIYSTITNGNYTSWSGTSMATPFAVGVAALLLSQNPALTTLQLKNLITSCYTPLTITTPLGEQTVKRLNAYKALTGDGYLPPDNLTAHVEGESIVLNWSTPTGVLPQGYNIYRGTSSTPINSTPITTLTYTDYAVIMGNIYIYSVRSVFTETESNSSQSVLVSMNAPLTTFEDGTTGGWVMINGTQTNKWRVGNATAFGSERSIYISNNNSANYYEPTMASTVHFYRDIRLLAGNDNVITFDVKVGGERGVDYLRVYLCETSINPTAGSYPSGMLLGEYSLTGGWVPKVISLPAQPANIRKRLVFTWRNNASDGEQPPAAVDNISFTDIGAIISISPTSWSFGGINLGETSPAQPFVITNTGNAPLEIESVTQTGTYASQFTHTLSSFPVNIAPGDSHTFTVTFAPLFPAGYKTANLNIYHNAVDSPAVLYLSGRCMGDVLPLTYLQTFSDADFPPTQPDWTIVDKDGDGLDWYLYNGSARSDSYYQNQPRTPDNWLISQPFTFEAGTTYAIRFSHRAYTATRPNDFMSVYLMSNIHPEIDCVDDAPGNTTIYAGTSISGWQTFTHTFTPEETIVRFIGFRHHNCAYEYGIQIDNVFIYKPVDIDLGIQHITGPSGFPTSSSFVLSLYNGCNTTVPAQAYQIAFKIIDSEGAVMPLGVPFTNTPAIFAWGNTQLTISDFSSWDFGVTTPTLFHIYAEIVYPADGTPDNNISEILPIYINPYSLIVDLLPDYDMGQQLYPVNYNMKDSLSQTIYTASEMGGMASRGRMTSMMLRLHHVDASPAIPVQIYMANGSASDIALNVWYSYDAFTKVYDAPLPLPPPLGGGNSRYVDLMIHLGTGEGSEDFVYEGGSLVVMMYKTYGTKYNGTNAWSLNANITQLVNRTIYFSSDNVGLINPQNPNQSGVAPESHIFSPGVVFYIDQYTSVYDETISVGAGLLGNYPNPFNPSTTISFEVGREGFVALDVYNVRGQKVRSLVSGVYEVGVHKVVWNGCADDGREVSSGVYFYRMVSGGFVGVRKMVLLK